VVDPVNFGDVLLAVYVVAGMVACSFAVLLDAGLAVHVDTGSCSDPPV